MPWAGLSLWGLNGPHSGLLIINFLCLVGFHTDFPGQQLSFAYDCTLIID